MNKTIEYAVNEALNMGRLSAKSQFLEIELREKIAQEIESLVIETSIDNAVGMKVRAAQIARGSNDSY